MGVAKKNEKTKQKENLPIFFIFAILWYITEKKYEYKRTNSSNIGRISKKTWR